MRVHQSSAISRMSVSNSICAQFFRNKMIWWLTRFGQHVPKLAECIQQRRQPERSEDLTVEGGNTLSGLCNQSASEKSFTSFRLTARGMLTSKFDSTTT